MYNLILIGPFPEDKSLIKGGIQASLYGLAESFKTREDIRTALVISLPMKADIFSSAKYSTMDGIEVIYLHALKFLMSAIIYLPLILRNIRKIITPIVHVNGTGLIQLLLLIILRAKSIPSVWTLHGITAKETLQNYKSNKTITNLLRYYFYKYLEYFSLCIAKEIIVDTEYVVTEIGYKKKNIHVIAQGIFTDEFSVIKDAPRNDPLIVSVGVLNQRKGHHLTIEAFAKVKGKIPATKLIIAGALPDAEYYDSLILLRKKLHLEDSIEFLTNIPRSEIISHLGKAKIFALHSEEESQGLALCEALAAGLPVVATNIGGIPYVVTDKADGLLVTYGDINQFADSIISLLTDDELYAKMATQAKISGQNFDWKNVADKMAKVYINATK